MQNKQIITTAALVVGVGLGINPIIHAESDSFGIVGANILQAKDEVVGSSTGWKIYADYFSTLDSSIMLGLDTHFTYLGTAKKNGFEYTQLAVGMALLAGYDFDVVKAYGSLGYSYWGVEAESDFSNEKGTGTTLTYGIGLLYPINDSFTLTADWVRFNDIAEASVDVFSAGISYKF